MDPRILKLELVEQGGLEESLLKIFFGEGSYRCRGRYRDNNFSVEELKDCLVSVKLDYDCKELIKAFSRYIGYNPHFVYEYNDDSVGFDWVEKGLGARGKALKKSKDIRLVVQLKD